MPKTLDPTLITDPVRFARGVLGKSLWPVQEEILHSLTRYRRTAVKACHASGKSYTAAAAVLWWISRYPDGIAITTAPTWTQVRKTLWAEIHQSLQAPGCGISFPNVLQTEIRINENRYAYGLSTNQGVNFQGFHGRILIVLDEAPGIEGDIWEAIEGIRAGGDVRILALGNPVVGAGPFYDAFTTDLTGWNTLTISAFDTPNLRGLTLESLLALPEDELDRNVRPYLTSRRWVKEKYYEWTPAHPAWQSRVMGQFPDQDESALISLAWLEAAKRREPTDTGKALVAGIDVAGPGEDETVVTVRCGNDIIGVKAWTQPDPRGEVLAYLRPYAPRLAAVNVDSAGIGYYFVKHLHDAKLRVVPINVGTAAHDGEKYANLKAEMYWGFRDRLQANGVNGLTDPQAISQLASVRYKHNPRGQVVIESKDDARKRGVKSPDRAESLMLAFHTPPPVRKAVVGGERRHAGYVPYGVNG